MFFKCQISFLKSIKRIQALEICMVKKSIGFVSVVFLSSPRGIHFPMRHNYSEACDI
ncbi:hypothetical protein DM01DRAFT_1340766 [Hesseltinella vesiculosa]|uniref:Uncharacterized protein n=1 Tax=Hesseltinella vesiculosa TaxID=101127 RepID=A0A1X2G367_9FUNG|nr:hypothetical protein DM01DRAFT_1340766 [Hesseltinella vesiculosa]